MTASAKTSPKHHKIRSLEVTGGFLQGIKMDFNDGLNCVIGGRGTGKTTVLEALRYSLGSDAERSYGPQTLRGARKAPSS